MIPRVGAGRMLVEDREPVVGRMALITLQGCHEMSTRLAGGRIAVMACAAGPGRNIVVIKGCRQPGDGRVTIITLGSCLYVITRLAGCRTAVVAGTAGTR